MRAMERQEKIHFDKYNLTNTFYKYILRNTFGQIHLDKFISPNTFLRTCLFLCFIVYDVRWGTIHYKSIYSNSLAQQLSWWKPNCFVCVIILKHMRLSLYCHTLFVSFVNLVFPLFICHDLTTTQLSSHFPFHNDLSWKKRLLNCLHTFTLLILVTFPVIAALPVIVMDSKMVLERHHVVSSPGEEPHSRQSV